MPPRIEGSSPAAAYSFGADSADTGTATVRLGETTLSQVAQRLGLDPGALQQANPNISDPSKLTVGQELRLPICQAPSSTDSGSDVSSPPTSTVASDPMAKIMVEMQLGAGPQQGSNVSSPVMFNAPVTAKAQQHDRWLTELGNRPDEAHDAWKNLSGGDRLTVVGRMSARYGDAFAQQFVESVQKGKGQGGTLSVYSSDPSSKLPTATTQQLNAWGYRYAGEDPRGEVWVRPSGDVIIRDTSTWKFGDQPPEPKTPPPNATSSPKTPGKVDGGDAPPPETPEDKAWNLLGRMQQKNDELSALLNRKPVPWDQVHLKVIQIEDAEKGLDKLLEPSDANATPPDLDDSFYDQVQTAKDDLQRLYDQASDRKPDFMQGPVVVPPDDDSD